MKIHLLVYLLVYITFIHIICAVVKLAGTDGTVVI